MSDLHNAAQMALEALYLRNAPSDVSEPSAIAAVKVLLEALAAQPESVYDTAVVKRIASQMGWTPPQPARKPMGVDAIVAISEVSDADLFLTDLIPIIRAVERHHGIGSKG